jgi:type IV pilus assembly protein PilQ
MIVSVSKSDFGTQTSADAPPPSTSKNISTNVLVDNGSTIVIGGIYSFSKSESHSGIPFLKDIPLIGWLFRTPYNPNMAKTELIIFLTPRIINQEEAGLIDTES